MKKFLSIISILLITILLFTACEYVPTTTTVDVKQTLNIGNKLSGNQPTPTDIDYSLERYNLIKRVYWVNGQREKARMLPCAIADIPLGYIILLTESGSVVGKFIVEGKVSSLNSYLTPDSEFYEKDLDHSSSDDYTISSVERYSNKWLPDVDGSYGSNDDGIFFFTPDGKYIEWTGIYLYSDIPFEVEDTVVKVVTVDGE